MDRLHFINPEYLWGLLFLLIPIIIHLFNFRKAKIVYFTRVDLLKEIKTKKRNFSTLKKRLILLTRLLAILFFVLATSSPYLSDVNLEDKSSKATFFYLDNSFSMQAKSGSFTLLDIAKKEIVKSYNDFNGVSQVYLLSNDEYSLINSENELMLGLSKIVFSSGSYSSLKVKSQITNLVEDNLISDFNTVVFSDFNENLVEEDSLFGDVKIAKIRIEQDEVSNVAVDSLWLKTVNIAENKFTVGYKFTNFGKEDVEFSESIKFNDKIQQSLTREIKLSSDTVLEIQLSIPKSKKSSGVISVQDGSIWYDNDLFFSVDFSKKAKVLFVGDRSSKSLGRILNDDFVHLDNTSHSGFKIKDLDGFDLLIYSISNFSSSELNKLKEYLKTGKELLLIPDSNISTETYSRVLKSLDIGRVVGFNSKKSAVTEINYKNNFFDDIFNSRVDNFEYPFVKGHFLVKIPNSEKLLGLEDGSSFLIKSKNVFLFTSAIFEGDEAFINNDLALPVLYKMSSSSLQRKLYEFAGEHSVINIEDVEKVSLDIGEKKENLAKVSFNSYELPIINKSGNFDLYSGDEVVNTVSYNYKRTESKIREAIVESTTESRKYKELKNQSNVNYLWKWCLTFTLAFLIIEMLLISFLKEKSIKISE